MKIGTHSRSKGFSLVEMLMAVSVLGILLGLVITNLNIVGDSVKDTRHKRNAQELAAVCNAAQAAGLEFIAVNDLDRTIRNVVAGGAPTDGAFAGRNFGLKHLQASDIAGVKSFLMLDGGLLRYSGTRIN